MFYYLLGCGQVVRHRFLVSAFVGSNPTTPYPNIKMLNDVFLSLNHCGFAFGKRKIFDDISLSIHKDDKTNFVGKNGVGKTTLFNIISNKIKIDSERVLDKPVNKVGYLNQRETFEEKIYILDFLRNHVQDSNNSDFLIKRLCKGLKIDVNQTLNELSGEMKRKINFSIRNN